MTTDKVLEKIQKKIKTADRNQKACMLEIAENTADFRNKSISKDRYDAKDKRLLRKLERIQKDLEWLRAYSTRTKADIVGVSQKVTRKVEKAKRKIANRLARQQYNDQLNVYIGNQKAIEEQEQKERVARRREPDYKKGFKIGRYSKYRNMESPIGKLGSLITGV